MKQAILILLPSITHHPFRRETNLSRRLVVNWSPSFLMSVEEIVTSGTIWRDLKYIAIWWKHDFPQFSTMIVRIDEKKYLCRILGQGCLLTITGKEVSHQSMFCSKSRCFGFLHAFILEIRFKIEFLWNNEKAHFAPGLEDSCGKCGCKKRTNVLQHRHHLLLWPRMQ